MFTTHHVTSLYMNKIGVTRKCRINMAQRKITLSVISSPCQRQCEILPSLGVRRLSSVVR